MARTHFSSPVTLWSSSFVMCSFQCQLFLAPSHIPLSWSCFIVLVLKHCLQVSEIKSTISI